jgi:hypothetical protein
MDRGNAGSGKGSKRSSMSGQRSVLRGRKNMGSIAQSNVLQGSHRMRYKIPIQVTFLSQKKEILGYVRV